MNFGAYLKSFTKTYLIISFLILALYILLNFIGSPLVKLSFSLFLVWIILGTLTQDYQDLLPLLIIFFTMEGQGRILFNYSALSRISFDLILLILIVRGYIKNKKLIPIKKLPKVLVILIYFHFSWYVFQIFNPDNAGIFAVVGASKVYIFPFLLFFFMLQNDLKEKTLKNCQLVTIGIILFQVSLSIYQMKQGEKFLLGISPYYAATMKDRFTGVNFRPFGTTFAPGGSAPYIAYICGFLLILPYQKMYYHVLYYLSVIFSLSGMFLMQIRSAILKFLLTIITISFVNFMFTKNKLKRVSKNGLILFVVVLISSRFINFSSIIPEENIMKSTERMMELTSIDSIQSQRISYNKAINIISQKLRMAPLGLGPGRTGGAISLGMKHIKNDPIFDHKHSWAFDNLYIALAIDFGVGMVFYLGIVFFGTAYLGYKALKNYFLKRQMNLAIISSAFISCIIMLVGNWGAIALPYNPESFAFWLWMSIGLNAVYNADQKQIEEEKQKENIDEYERV